MKLEKRGALCTGIESLDRKLGGGIPLGTVTALSTSPASQSEVFLYDLAASRSTVYLTTIRTEKAIEHVLDERIENTDNIEVIKVEEGDPHEHAREVLSDLEDEVNIVIDPVDILESYDSTSYRWFLRELSNRVVGSKKAAFLHCLNDDPTPENRRETIYLADLVFQVTTEVRGDSIVNQLTVPKFRSGQSIEEVIKLDLTTEVEVDLSRNLL